MNSIRLEMIAPPVESFPAPSSDRKNNSAIRSDSSMNHYSSNFTIGYLASSSLTSFLANKLTMSNSIAVYVFRNSELETTRSEQDKRDVVDSSSTDKSQSGATDETTHEGFGLDSSANASFDPTVMDIFPIIQSPPISLDAVFENIANALTGGHPQHELCPAVHRCYGSGSRR